MSSWLTNDGDIILDAVLTDTGRKRLAMGDGSFRIVKFALSDDEINYENYNSNHPSGSAFYDLEILQAPVLEAFANNQSSMKSKLVSISRTNLLYLPVMKLNEVFSTATKRHSNGSFTVAVDKDTELAVAVTGGSPVTGVIYGETVPAGSHIRLDQGLDTDEISPSFPIDSDLLETQYIIEIDNRFGHIIDAKQGRRARVSYIDDDNIASYFLTLGNDSSFVQENTVTSGTDATQVIAGPRGTFIEFGIQSSIDLNTSTFLFNQLGGVDTTSYNSSVSYIDTVIRVSGATTGYSIDIPVRFVKL